MKQIKKAIYRIVIVVVMTIATIIGVGVAIVIVIRRGIRGMIELLREA
jgi:hypothetical protein